MSESSPSDLGGIVDDVNSGTMKNTPTDASAAPQEAPDCDHPHASDDIKFKEVLSRLNLDAIPQLAQTTHRNLQSQHHSGPYACSIDTENPMAGSYNIAYRIDFTNGDHWLIKIPANGTPDHFTPDATQAFLTQVRIMQFVKERTSIPVPTIYAFDVSCDNKIRAPYILMDFVQGTNLSVAWHDYTVAREELVRRNSRTLRELATAILQLNDFTFQQGGAPMVSEDCSSIKGIGPSYIDDQQAGILAQCHPDDTEGTSFFRSIGPFSTCQEQLFATFDPPPEGIPNRWMSENTQKLVHLLLAWTPQHASSNGDNFVLTHPDFDTQNIFVDSEGGLVSIIDWDSVQVVPRCLGNEKYPRWLTRDLDEAYSPARIFAFIDGNEASTASGTLIKNFRDLSPQEMERETQTVWYYDEPYNKRLGRWVLSDTPEELDMYRDVWEDAVLAHTPVAGRKQAKEIIKASRLGQNLAHVARVPSMVDALLETVFEEMEKLIMLKEACGAKERDRTGHTTMDNAADESGEANTTQAMHDSRPAQTTAEYMQTYVKCCWKWAKRMVRSALDVVPNVCKVRFTRPNTEQMAQADLKVQKHSLEDAESNAVSARESSEDDEDAEESESNEAEDEENGYPFKPSQYAMAMDIGDFEGKVLSRLKKGFELLTGVKAEEVRVDEYGSIDSAEEMDSSEDSY